MALLWLFDRHRNWQKIFKFFKSVDDGFFWDEFAENLEKLMAGYSRHVECTRQPYTTPAYSPAYSYKGPEP
jgi:hypothetical protein